MHNFTDIPLPQDTKLYEVNNGKIREPRLSLESLSYSCIANTDYSTISNIKFILQLYNQNSNIINISINDKNISSLDNSSSYFGLNGFDHSLDCRFINHSAPTICFLPIIKASDNNKNIDISTGFISATDLSYTNLSVNDYILLTNQTLTTQNIVYRIIGKNGDILEIYNDSNINTILSQNQNYIFTRALIENTSGRAYYGLYNTTTYQWASQTKGVQLQDADYGITKTVELSSNKLPITDFTLNNVIPKINEVIAINIIGGGKTTGIYIITKLENNFVYFAPIYPAYVFIHQFTKIKTDFNTLSNSIWYVNPSYLGAGTYVYSSINFAFNVYDSSSILSNPALWGRQVGGANDTILGFSLFTEYANNNYIKNSDIFSIGVKVPSWAADGAKIFGLSLNAIYDTNMLDVNEEAVII